MLVRSIFYGMCLSSAGYPLYQGIRSTIYGEILAAQNATQDADPNVRFYLRSYNYSQEHGLLNYIFRYYYANSIVSRNWHKLDVYCNDKKYEVPNLHGAVQLGNVLEWASPVLPFKISVKEIKLTDQEIERLANSVP